MRAKFRLALKAAVHTQNACVRAERGMDVVRALAEAYFAFMRASEQHIRMLGLTAPQFDVIATLGNTEGMSCKELASRTLVTKGTLTGVLDRLERRGLIARDIHPGDRRRIHVRLTEKGQTVFAKVFPAHMAFLKPYLKRALACVDTAALKSALRSFAAAFRAEVTKAHLPKKQATNRKGR